MKNTLILSLFPGIDLFGKAFEEQGACIVQAQDKILGGDICNFKPVKGRFDGVIGGSPCQDYSRKNRNPSNYSDKMLSEYKRVVLESQPEWFLHENVVGVPEFEIDGYKIQRFILDLAWFSDYSRQRVFTFGSKRGVILNPIYKTIKETKGTAVLGGDSRSYEACCEIQGLDKPLDLSFLNLESKKQVIANAVPLQIGRYIAGLINDEYYKQTAKAFSSAPEKHCACGCGRRVLGRAKTANATCRKRVSRKKAA